MITRRRFVAAGICTVVAPLAVRAQQAPPMPRIGFLSAAPLSSITARIEAFRAGLREFGYVEGRSITIDWRSADETWSRLPDLATQLIRQKVVAIVCAEARFRSRCFRAPIR